jgi:hypothetical protein
MGIGGKPCPKPLPRATSKVARVKRAVSEDKKAKAEIREFHGQRCTCCQRKGYLEVHEEKRRGAGGVVSLQNSYLACVPPTGSCHALLQQRHIYAERKDGREPFDATKPLRFTMSRRVLNQVFGGWTPLKHWHVLPDGL